MTSHDLQEPLRNILVAADALSHGDDPEMRTAIARSAGILSERIDALLEVSLLDRDHTQERVDLAEIIACAITSKRAILKEANAMICLGPLPEITAHREQMTDLFSRLLANSAHFRGDEPARIEITSRRGGLGWVISIRDNGIGIDPAHADRAFALFQRLSDDVTGVGVGLPIARRIAQRHGGALYLAEVQPAIGAEFTLDLPDTP